MLDAIFLYNPVSDEATLSGGNWLSDGNSSLSSVQNDKYWQMARSASALPFDTQIRVSLDSPMPARGFAVILPNATPLARVRLSAYTSSSFDTQIFTTGWIVSTGESGRWKDDERAPVVSSTFDEISVQYWLVEIDDSANLSRHIEVARLYIAGGMSPSLNYIDTSNGLSFRDNSLKSNTLSGNSYFWRRINPREWQCEFGMIPETEMYRDAYEFLRYVGFDREVFIIPTQKDDGFQQERRFFGRILQQSPLVQAKAKLGSFGFTFSEMIAKRGDSGPPQIIAKASFDGVGSMSVAYSATYDRSAAIHARGTMRASYDRSIYGRAHMSAHGVIDVAASGEFSRMAGMSAKATLNVVGGSTSERSAHMSATGQMSASAGKYFPRNVDIIAAGSMEANAVAIRVRSVEFVGEAHLTISGDQQRTVRFDGASKFEARYVKSFFGSVSLIGSSGFTASPRVVKIASVNMAASGNIAVSARRMINRSSAFNAVSVMNATFGRGFNSGFSSGFR